MKIYSKYKPSKADWLGDIPDHWEFKKLKYIGKAIIGLTYSPNDVETDFSGTLVLRSVNIQNSKLDLDNTVYVSAKIPKKLKARDGDILVCSRNGSVSLIGKSIFIENPDENTTWGAFMTVVRSPLRKYLYYALNSDLLKYNLGLFATSTINQLTTGTLNSMFITVPPHSEQLQIVSFLDRQTSEIDRVIATREKQLELLNELRISVISKAVTKGIDPNVKLKPSGVEWIGKIPEHWKKISFRYVIDVLTDFTANGSFADLAKNVTYLEDGFSRLIRLTDLRENLENAGIYVSEESHKYLSKSSLYGGEILLANVGAYAGLAWKVPQLKMPSTLGPNMFLLKFDSCLYNEFAYCSLISYYLSEQLKNKAISAAQPKLNKEDLRSCFFLLPPKDEQLQIVDYIEQETKEIDSVIEKYYKQIELLKSYKTSLISEVVTGKIDVREQANN